MEGMVYAQNNNQNYVRYFDSADVYINTDPKLATIFLDSIPEPTDKYIKGQVDRYYAIRARIQYQLNNVTESHKLWLIALQTAEESKDLNFAAYTAIQISIQHYELGNEEEGDIYIQKAIANYKKTGNQIGILETKQVPAFHKFQNKKWADCIKYLETDLPDYKALDKQYLYAFAIHMLASSHYNLDNYKEGLKYTNLYINIEDENPVNSVSFYEANQRFYQAKYFYRQKMLDSSLIYLNKVYHLNPHMEYDFQKDIYNLGINLYNDLGEYKIKYAYTDSLLKLETKIREANVKSGIKLSNDLVEKESLLNTVSSKRKLYLILTLLSLVLVMILSVLLYKNRLTVKNKVASFKDKLGELSYLKSNQQKLTAKVKGLEDYINELKSEIKNISKVGNLDEQRSRITELYKNVHVKSSNVLAKGESHLELINELNEDFFLQINNKYPELNESEIIICYYLFMGFKNKEIALFLNTSVRSIESKRYRIGKKINLSKDDSSLQEHLNIVFKDTKQFST